MTKPFDNDEFMFHSINQMHDAKIAADYAIDTQHNIWARTVANIQYSLITGLKDRIKYTLSNPIKSPKKGAEFLSNIMTAYFEKLGLYSVLGVPGIPTFKRPSILIACRNNLFHSLFAQTLLKDQVILPVLSDIKKISLSKWWPQNLMKHMITPISYEDTHLDNDLDNIKTLLNAGHNVMIYLNYGFANPSTNRNTLYIHESFYPFLKESTEVDIYFLNLDGIENYHISSTDYPESVLCSIYSYQDVLGHIPDTKHDQLTAITEFYSYLNYMIV